MIFVIEKKLRFKEINNNSLNKIMSLKLIGSMSIIAIVYYYASKTGYEIWKAKLKDFN